MNRFPKRFASKSNDPDTENHNITTKGKKKKSVENTIKTATGSPDSIASPASSMISVT